MNSPAYYWFLKSDETLRVYADDRLLFSSRKEGLLPLLEYLGGFDSEQGVLIFDKVVGNAAVLLAIKARCQELYSPLGSQFAVTTLDKYGIRHHISDVVPYIQQANGEKMCPMEELSLDKTPEEFYSVVTATLSRQAMQTFR